MSVLYRYRVLQLFYCCVLYTIFAVMLKCPFKKPQRKPGDDPTHHSDSTVQYSCHSSQQIQQYYSSIIRSSSIVNAPRTERRLREACPVRGEPRCSGCISTGLAPGLRVADVGAFGAVSDPALSWFIFCLSPRTC